MSGRIVCIIVPFRDGDGGVRAAQLQRLMAALEAMPAAFTWCVIKVDNSDTTTRFNRGVLLNAGFYVGDTILALPRDNTVYVFHDVDLVPDAAAWAQYATLNPANSRDAATVFHLASVWPRYMSADGYGDRYLGGVVAMTAPAFLALNGFPNNYWGWAARTTSCIAESCRVAPSTSCGTTWGRTLTWKRSGTAGAASVSARPTPRP